MDACTGCYKLFHGVVRKADTKGDRGHTYTDADLEGVKEYAGHTYRVWVKNENILSWLDGRPDVMSPDFIYNLDPKTGDAITSRELGGYPVGTEVAIVAGFESDHLHVEGTTLSYELEQRRIALGMIDL